MAFKIRGPESVDQGIKHVAVEQIDKAIQEIESDEIDQEKTVHQVRKRCKKMRGLVRLVRPDSEAVYKNENRRFRNAAKSLSHARDAQVIVETYGLLLDHYGEEIDSERFSPIYEALLVRSQQVTEHEVNIEDRLNDFLDEMQQAYKRVEGWELSPDVSASILKGIKKTYKRGRRAMKHAYNKQDATQFHQWRKRVKYHWYHMRLLERLWPKQLKQRAEEVKRLSEYLGDDHDLAMLHATLINEVQSPCNGPLVAELIDLISKWQVELRSKAKSLGMRIYAESPKLFMRRIESYWNAWLTESGALHNN